MIWIKPADADAPRALAAPSDATAALLAYDRARGPATAALVRANRRFVLDEVMRTAHERAPNGFADIAAVLSRAEMEDVARRYQQSVTWAKREGAAEERKMEAWAVRRAGGDPSSG